jgi:hypothetical protein
MYMIIKRLSILSILVTAVSHIPQIGNVEDKKYTKRIASFTFTANNN